MALYWMGWVSSIFFSTAQGQTASSSSSQEIDSPALPFELPGQSEIQNFQAEQLILGQSLNALIAQGATPQQMQGWLQQNAPALANQQQSAVNIAAESELQPMPVASLPNVPAAASSTLRDFLTAQVSLANARAQIHNQLVNALPAEVSDQQISQMEQSEAALFQQQHASDIQAQQQRAQTLAVAAAQQSTPTPPPLVIATGTSPRLAAFLILRDKIIRDQIALLNQYTTADPATRNAALLAWLQQNSARNQQLQQLAQNLSQSTGN